MRLIIAGSRTLSFTPQQICWIVEHFKLTPFIIVNGTAGGVDFSGYKYGKQFGILVEDFPAPWNDINHKDAVVKTTKYGHQYDATAGHRRNAQMAEYADALLLIWDGTSNGSANMKQQIKKLNKPIYEVVTCQSKK